MGARFEMLVGATMLAAACSPAPTPWDGPVLTEPRTELTVQQLLDEAPAPWLDTSFLARPDWASSDVDPLQGTLELRGAALELGSPPSRALYAGEDRFPTVRLDWLAHEGALIPAHTGLIRTDEASLWDVLVGTGAVWHEADDGDWSRASFPLDLVDRYFNQVRNCVVTFAYRGDETTPAYVQCSQETADAADEQLGDLRVFVPTSLTSRPSDPALLIEAHERAQAARIPVQPLRELDTRGDLGALFDRSVLTNASTSVGAVYLDGTLYAHPAMTRHGPHPYPDQMHHGVYSVTKSLLGALVMSYAAQRYGEAVFDERITDHVPELANAPGWQDVTFADCLDMATGTRGGEAAELLYQPLVLADDAHQALRNIAALGDAPEAPGEAFHYATTHTFVLSVALQHYVEAREGEDVRYLDLVRDEVLEPIGAGDLDVLLTREDDPGARIPYLGFGARPTLDQAAKIARLFADEGVHEGEQLLHRGRVRRALGRTDWQGLRIDGRRRYRHSFWSRSVRVGGCRTQLAYMQGHGGNHIALHDSGAIVFRFSDELDEDLADLARGVERVVSSCDSR